ncbi:MAG: T9SS type A sorting domain-containing protein, partial [Acidimicrobiia bacterium]|nr:T9SS type A sorting domain-containing protein [Acidimicrobiia bacterium]
GEYCAPCHVSHVPGPGGSAPLFTDFTYDNIGVPRNPENPFYDMDEVFLDDGSPINPLGDDFVDFGLGNFLRSRPEWQHLAAENDGKFKVPTLRNVDKRPGNGFPKAYMHNGVFKTLLQVVHFYNTRDVAEENWPPPEVDVNVNRELLEGVPLGDLQLAEEAEFAIVAFLRTLSDGFRGRRGSRTVSPISLNVTGPNPFNPSTFVTYSLPQPAVAKLYVFNVAGQKVATVVDGWKDAGEHRATFVADGLPSGVYFLQLVSGSEKVTTKAVLLK